MLFIWLYIDINRNFFLLSYVVCNTFPPIFFGLLYPFTFVLRYSCYCFLPFDQLED